MMSQSYDLKKITIPYEWQVMIYKNIHGDEVRTSRSKVIGGWIILNELAFNDNQNSQSMVFVPDPNHQWETQ